MTLDPRTPVLVGQAQISQHEDDLSVARGPTELMTQAVHRAIEDAGVTALGSIDALGQMFRATVHRVHNQVATVTGDAATGETYCTADHLLNDVDSVLVWTIRYLDRWRREDGQWRFTHRKLIVEWEEIRAVTVKDAASAGEGKTS